MDLPKKFREKLVSATNLHIFNNWGKTNYLKLATVSSKLLELEKKKIGQFWFFKHFPETYFLNVNKNEVIKVKS